MARKICYSQLCILGEREFVARSSSGLWELNEVAANQLYCAVANGGAEMQRILPWGVWGARPAGLLDQFAPYPLVDAPIAAPAGGPPDAQLGTAKKFDLSRFNDWYFPIVRRLISIARSYEIKTTFCFGDSCQFHNFQNSKRFSPFVTNVNGITTLWEDGAHPIFKAFVERCLAELSGLGVGWSWGNEMNVPHFLELARDVIFPLLRSGAIAAESSTLGATAEKAIYENGQYTGGAGLQDDIKKAVGEEFGDDVKQRIWREVHGVGGGAFPAVPNMLDQVLYWWGNHAHKIWLSDDGVWDGDSPCDFQPDTGRRRPSAARWKRIVEIARGYSNNFVFEHLPKGGDVACQKATVTAIYRALNDKDPEEKWHYEPPPPPPAYIKRKICASSHLTPGPYCPAVIEIEFPAGSPEPPLCTEHTAPPAEASCYERFIAGRPIWKWQIGAFLRCLLGG
jgi:hypothetical protein